MSVPNAGSSQVSSFCSYDIKGLFSLTPELSLKYYWDKLSLYQEIRRSLQYAQAKPKTYSLGVAASQLAPNIPLLNMAVNISLVACSLLKVLDAKNELSRACKECTRALHEDIPLAVIYDVASRTKSSFSKIFFSKSSHTTCQNHHQNRRYSKSKLESK